MTEEDLTLDPLLLDLGRRGLFKDCTDKKELSRHLAESRAVYAGFDPTKDSLTIGNLVSVLMLRRFQMAGHRPFVVMGGGTGLIGDPSGKDQERSLLTREQIHLNITGQRTIFERLLQFDGPAAARLVNNAEWIEKLTFVDVLRDVGKHFSVNMMIEKDSVKKRLREREQGISYTEFSYMILQALDFAELSESRGVTVQLGGSDQWGNIVAGVELTRKSKKKEVFGLTTPLVTKKDGGKFGKTEAGAIWLTRAHTSPYSFYQFWINASDEDVEVFLKVFSLRPLSEIEDLLFEHAKEPGARRAQQALAEELTRLLHGEDALLEAKQASAALFSGDVGALSEQLIDEAFAAAPATEFSLSRLRPDGLGIVELMVETGVAKSKREARQFVTSGAVSVNGQKVDESFMLSEDGLLYKKIALLRRGKKTWHVCRMIDT